MLERFAAQILNRYIGQYVENFNPQNLSIGIVQGAVELENLRLRKDALKEFDLPGIDVKWGYIGNITLRIPSYKNYSEPWVIDVKKLYLIVGPCKNNESVVNEEDDSKLKEERKRNQLAELEERWHATQGMSKSIYAIWRSYSSSIVTNIVENLQVRLFDLHVRYEDDTTLPETFAFGTHINILSAQTTDEDWNPKSSSASSAEKKWKKMHLEEMSFYWDTKSHILNGLSPEELIEAMVNHTASGASPFKKSKEEDELHQFVLSPVSGEARLTRACSLLPLRSRNNPRLSLDVDLPSIPLFLRRKQYCQVLAFASEMARKETRSQYKSGRPTKSILESPSGWWSWSIEQHIQKIKFKRERSTLQFMSKRAKLVVDYVKKYKTFLNAKYFAKSNTKELSSALQEMQTKMSLPELHILHELVYAEVDEENRRKTEPNQKNNPKTKLQPMLKTKQTKEQSSQGWRWGWLGKWRGKETANDNQDANIDTTEAEENLPKALLGDNLQTTLHASVFKDLNDEEIYEMFGDELSNQDTTDTFLKRDSVLLKLNFSLNSGSLTLAEDRNDLVGTVEDTDIVSLEFRTVKVASEWRPRYGTHQIKMDLGGVVLRDLNPLNTHFCDLVKPSTRKHRPMSPLNITPPDIGMRTRANDMLNNLLGQSKNSVDPSQEFVDAGEGIPVFSVTYEKLPQSGSSLFSDRLEIVTAPLVLTFLPGITDRMTKFFKTPDPSDSNYASSGVESELLTTAAKERYEAWMKQAQAEVKNTVRRLMQGKAETKVSKDKWAISLDIFAPEIIIPEDWSNPNSRIVILNLGHMTFENHEENEVRPPRHRIEEQTVSGAGEDDSDDDFVTPPNTPPSEAELLMMSQRTNQSNLKLSQETNNANKQEPPEDEINKEKITECDLMDQEVLTERMLWDKMYERYHLQFAELQVLVASNRAKWLSYRHGGKTSMHLVDRFSVELLAERRMVPTTDPHYPAVMVTGKLPHLTLHISHKKVHTAMKCLDQLWKKDESDVDATQNKFKSASPSKAGLPSFNVRPQLPVMGSDETLAKANSKQLACDFLINQISVVLEEETENQIISVLEVSRIQTKFIERPFDSSMSLSIYSLLLVDVMQQLGHDYELLLASHRSVYMDVGSGHMLDSGTASPMSLSQAQSGQTNYDSSTSHVKRCASDSSKLDLYHPTSSMLDTVAENLRHFAQFSNRYFSSSSFPRKFSGEVSAPESEDVVGLAEAAAEVGCFEYLITLEIKNLRKGSPDLQNNQNPSLGNLSPCNRIDANFSNLDVVFNSSSWVAILDFLHKLKPTFTSSKPRDSLNDNHNLKPTPFDSRQLKASSALTTLHEEGKSSLETHVNVEFKKLNILLLRHVAKFGTTVGRKLATVTMQGASVVANLGSKDFNFTEDDMTVQLDLSGSIASLLMQDLTSTLTSSSPSQGFGILSIGMYDDQSNTSIDMEKPSSGHDSEQQVDAFSFEFKQGTIKETNIEPTTRIGSQRSDVTGQSVSEPVMPVTKMSESMSDTNASDGMLFNMDTDAVYQPQTAVRTESRVMLKMASTCYIHSPRFVAEIMAFVDEAGDFARAQMTTATRQAYKDMARSIMDKVSDYSMAMLGKSLIDENDLTTVDGNHTLGAMHKSFKHGAPAADAKLCFKLQMQTPIVALPKFPGSFELLVANLGQIAVQNDHDVENGCGPMDTLNILVENMNLRSHRQKDEELAAKKATEQPSSSKLGPSIAELKRDSLRFMEAMNNSDTSNQPLDKQILHKTSLQLTIQRKHFVPSPKSSLEVRKCCKESDENHCSENHSCDYFTSHVGLLSDKRMCVDIQAATGFTVTLSKHAYEQVLKTLDNVAFGGDIDVFGDDENVFNAKPQHSASAPNLHGFSSKNIKSDKSLRSSTSSYQSTPRGSNEPVLFDLPGLEIPKKNSAQNLQILTQRKYTPISANITVPCLVFQLSGDLSEGEQGIVKVTLERFTGSYLKEKKFGTEIDLSLGSLDIEDLLQPKESPNRHIVVSFSHSNKDSTHSLLKTEYLSTSCPAFIRSSTLPRCNMSTSMPSVRESGKRSANIPQRKQTSAGVFRPYDSFNVASGFSRPTSSQPVSPTPLDPNEEAFISPAREESCSSSDKAEDDSTLVRIKAFLVDGNSEAYKNVYDRVNRRIDVDFNSLDCKVNLQTWVVLLDFFGIGTSPKKDFQLDPVTEQMFSWDQRLDVMSFYENQPKAFINSEIDFTVRSFNLTLNKQEYELLKANVAGVQSHIQIRDGMLSVSGQLGGLSVSDLSPNGSFYRERFIFTGDKALDFELKKFDEYDLFLKRDFDISLRLRMSSIRYIHTQRFQNETVAFCQHFQQLQEVLGRMRAASVGQNVRSTSCRQARVLLDIEADAPIILIPESSHSDRLLVANLGHITVCNKFINDGMPGTLSYQNSSQARSATPGITQSNQLLVNTGPDSSTKPHRSILDVIHVDLIDMDLFTAKFKQEAAFPSSDVSDASRLVFPSYTVTCDARPLLKEKVKLELQMERNLEKEITHQGVPDTALSARLSSVYCAIDHNQYWLIRGVLDHNAGEAIPDFPQPTAFLQPSKLQTVLTGSVYTGLSMDFYLTNVSFELLQAHAADGKPSKSLGRLDFVKSKLSYRAFSNNIKTTNLSCEAFRAHDTRFVSKSSEVTSVFTNVLGPMASKTQPLSSRLSNASDLQFEIYQRSGPGFMEFTALLNNMRVYLILDWLQDMNDYILKNPNQVRCDSLRANTAQLMSLYGQVDSRNQRGLDSSGQLEPEVRSNEMKMSFTDTEFVLMEDTSRLDSDAVILRSTAVLHYFPDEGIMHQNPTSFSPGRPTLSCSLQSLEVFSCQLDKENETALSIIDPITINFDVRPVKQTDLNQEEIVANPSILDKSLLDIHVSELNIRVSYNDVMLFLKIFKSLTSKKSSDAAANIAPGSDVSSSSKQTKAVFQPTQSSVEPLVQLGYSRSDVVHALTVCSGSVELAGSWLVEHAILQESSEATKKPQSTNKKVPLDMAKVCLHAEVLRVCLIDDCADDCDVPLTEMAVRALNIRQDLTDMMTGSLKDLLLGQTGSATFKLSGDYYNRMLSLWEPFLEPWRCNVCWRNELGRTEQSAGKWNVQLQASDRFDISVTSTLIETLKKTLSTWRQDYTQVDLAKSVPSPRSKRQPFVPYLLRNLTGSVLRFATQTAALHEAGHTTTQSNPSDWVEVYPGEVCSFNFATMHEKQRHKRSESLKLHQISVQVGEWKTLEPVAVSKVGVYFRHAFKQISKSSTVYEPLVPVRVVFSVTLEGSAQKVVTVRSALAVRNRVKIPIQIQLQQPNLEGSINLPLLESGSTLYIPLSLTSSAMRIRPCIASHNIATAYDYSSKPIQWQHVTRENQEESELVECNPTKSDQQKFYFAVCVQRQPYPSYEEVCEMLSQHGELEDQRLSDWLGCLPQLPGHTITILPPVVISNLLPCDLHYYVKNKNVEGTLKPGLDATPHAVFLSPSNQASLIVGCLIDGFQSCRELIIPSIVKNFMMRMRIKDWKNETLVLNVRILWRLGCSVKISIMAGYWIINKTGLPIVVKQEGTQAVAAGQYEAHEQARSLQPLLFSYANREGTFLCTMRLGKQARMEDYAVVGGNLQGIPSFCERFSVDGGSCTRNLKLITKDGTPNREFCIGISVRRGWGRYLHTHIVTIAPRFLLINQTKSLRLSFAQRHTISYTSDSAGTSCHLSIMPGSSVVFHWPRVDLDTLLCVRLADEPSCHWSGGFFIDRTDAFHVALRLASKTPSLTAGKVYPLAPHCVFLNIEVTLVNATYCIAISEADPSIVPPPLRVDNVSSAPIIFKQVGTDESYNTEVPAESQLAYACDEPCLAHKIKCSVRGGSTHVNLDMNVIGEEKQLYYENYFYVTIGSGQHLTASYDRLTQESVVLVLDVQGGQKSQYITLQLLRSGKRSQLWRMTSDGRIYHEGSSPPEKGSSGVSESAHRSHRSSGLVLDIAEMAINVGHSFNQGIPLALRPSDERRRSTQTWKFDGDGRLKCRHKNLSVQVSELCIGSPVMLASYDEMRVCLPTELCYRHKLIPGSGCLSLKVVRDGPTRVLRVVDIRQKRAGIYSKSSDWTLLESSSSPSTSAQTNNEKFVMTSFVETMKFSASISMPQGVGISLISNAREELLYLTMNGVNMSLSAEPSEQVFSLRVQNMQIDNQLLDGYPVVMLSPQQSNSSRSKSSPSISRHAASSSTDPLISVTAVRQPSTNRMYEIYKSLVVDVGRLSIAIEERLLLKLLYFSGFGLKSTDHDTEVLDEAKMDVNFEVTEQNYNSAKRLYFDTLRLSASPLRLSVITASRLPPELKAVKQALTFSLIQFERAPVALQAYVKRHLFETMSFILADFSKHLRDQLKSQAAKILGSVDFLGNPIGLIGDVKAGVEAGLAHGNLQNMVMHFTHGLSDSTAKFTSALSDGLGEIAMDEDYEDKRRAIQANARSSAGSHVVAGLQGLMAGVVGGLTSVVTQPVKGAQSDGAAGFFKGVFKGVVGTVTKPVTERRNRGVSVYMISQTADVTGSTERVVSVQNTEKNGVLDLASESASAVRHISVSNDQIVARARLARCCHSFQGCLQIYSKSQAEGQSFLYALNRNDYSEHFYSCDKLNNYARDNILVVITNKKVYFVNDGEPDLDHVILAVTYADLIGVAIATGQADDQQGVPGNSRGTFGEKTFLELTMKSAPRTGGYSFSKPVPGQQSSRYYLKKPRVACHSRSVAERVCQQIRYAKNLASEQTETMQCDPDEEAAQDRAFQLEV